MKPISTDPAAAASPARQARLALSTFLPYRLNVVAQLVAEALAESYAETFGLGIPEWRVIATLGEYDEMTARDIGRQSRMHKTKVSRAISALDERGLIDRRSNEEDRREAFVSLSREGRETYAAIVPIALGFAERLTDGVPQEDLAAFGRVIEHLMQRCAALHEEPPAIDQ
ncbi:DNA-binding MarR family transcriptional regulator [Chelatococcus caeni]|uniref:DNA-binding MarR family transcriptional regulator n=1 Tax=Chelatococcus caeni TaxID=1348468 RepID=A0A840BV51_9HYPH|nr:MarR family transcriptional regulator [Chelatococcus caeni]MBB4015562.1 DNA-binding MarR family transcriptional regulator [Chelatococcus caeni]